VDAVNAVDLAMPLVRMIPMSAGVEKRADALRARATILLKLRRPEEAGAMLGDALAGFAKAGNARLVSSLRVDAAAALEQAGDVDAAVVELHEALRAIGSLADSDSGRGIDALLALGRIHLRARDATKAREALAQAQLQAKTAPPAVRIDVLSAAAALEQADGRADHALALLDEAVAVAAHAGDAVAEARLRQQLARLHQQSGRIPEALAAAKQSLASATRLGWDDGIAVAGQLVQNLEARS
jgi:tetratricopeptide (TPR) repeat protein